MREGRVRTKRKARVAAPKRAPAAIEPMGVPYEVKKLARKLKVSTTDAGDLLNNGRAHRKQGAND